MEDLLRLAKSGKFDDVEAAWMEALTGDLPSWQALLEVAEAIVRRRRTDLAESLLWYLMTELADRGDLEGALKAAVRACELLPGSDVMRDEAAELYPRVHDESETVRALVRLTLGDRDIRLDVAIRRLETLRRLKPGTYVRKDPGAKFARVERVDAERGKLILALEGGAKGYDLAAAESLSPVPPDDFRALSVFERDRLSKLAEENPEELITLALRTFGGRLEMNRLKLYVEPLLPPGTWSRWWSSVKRTVRESPHIGLTKGSAPNVFLRSRPVTRQEQLRNAFKAGRVQERLSVALQALGEPSRDETAHRELLEYFAGEMAAFARRPSGATDGQVLATLAVLDLLERELPPQEMPDRPDPVQRLGESDPVAAVCEWSGNEELAVTLLDAVRRWLPEQWPEVFAEAIPRLPRNACEHAAKRLAEEGAWEWLRVAAESVLEQPQCHSGALVWLWKARASSGGDPGLRQVAPIVVLRRLLSAAASLAHAAQTSEAERRQQLSQIRQALLAGDRAALRGVIESADEDSAAAILSLAEANPGLTRQARAELVRTIRSVRPSLFKKETPPWEEEVIYVTAEGIRKQRERLNRIVNVRMPRVIKEIGEAAAFGDLSDNAEYTAAMEERGRLATQVATIQDELHRSRLIEPDMAARPYVTIGSRVRARNLETDEVEDFSFLGPWDADPAARIYSYKAPLGMAFMGSTVGSRVVLRSGGTERCWEIVEVSSALDA